ncbi:GlxA family transcriptional regulator [Acidisoma silvae]|uniref:GlxA family transcriptional regulator n=1 Tax=Acidisoma silvae TaxID=2802396 RepID=A0A963YU92_9PROT|nr:GlxA family transcriptional regulator [Acidisoma silvae]MCB8876500.1 GlxA family transcriptional regulator [Acidisoma silvae]
MLTVGFVVSPGFPIMSLAALSVFEFANVSTGRDCYDIHILSETGGPIRTAMGTSLETAAWGERHFDTLIIGGNTAVHPTSAGLQSFITAAARTSRRLSSICTGVFALADTGVLGQRRVTTHWLFTEDFANRFPDLRLDRDRIFIVDGPIWTAAGNSAGIDLTLAMLEMDYGAALAHDVARIMVVDHLRPGAGSQHSAMLAMKPRSDRIQAALAHARQNLQAVLSVEVLAQVAGLSPRQFSRAFQAETGTSPAKAIETLRIEAAQLMIAQSCHPIEIIAAESGFGDQERMRRAFLRGLGRPPQAVRAQAKARSARG